MKKALFSLVYLLAVISLCSCTKTDDVSLVDPSETQAIYNQQSPQDSTTSDEQATSDTSNLLDQPSTDQSQPQVSTSNNDYDDSLYPAKAITPYRMNATLLKAGYEDLYFTETEQNVWTAKSGNLDLTCETQIYIVQGFLYKVKVKDWSKDSVVQGTKELCAFINTVYPDAIDNKKQQEIVNTCLKAVDSEERADIEVTYQYKDEPTTWFNFGINYKEKTISAYNPYF